MEHMSIEGVAAREKILSARPMRAKLGVSVSSLQIPANKLVSLLEVHKEKNHVLVNDVGGLSILLKEQSTEKDILLAYCHAIIYQQTKSE
jgi:hypothetical protein